MLCIIDQGMVPMIKEDGTSDCKLAPEVIINSNNKQSFQQKNGITILMQFIV